MYSPDAKVIQDTRHRTKTNKQTHKQTRNNTKPKQTHTKNPHELKCDYVHNNHDKSYRSL